MRILFTRFPLESSAHGGAENQTMWLATGLREHGHAVSFLGSCPVLLQTFSSANFDTSKLDIGPPPVTKWSAASFLWRRTMMLQRLERAIGSMPQLPDAVMMLSVSEKVLLTDWLVSRGVKVLWVEHDRIGPWLTKNPWLPALKKASQNATLITVSDLSRRMYGELGFNESGIVAIPNGVPEPFSHGPSSLDPFSRPFDRLRASREKGSTVEKNAMNPQILTFARSMRKEPTEAEKLLWGALRNRQLGVKFRRQHPIASWILDFYCDEYKVGIEIDGPIHDDEERMYYDNERTELLRDFHIRIIRFTNKEVLSDVEKVVKKIFQELHSPLPSGEGLGVRVPGEEISIQSAPREENSEKILQEGRMAGSHAASTKESPSTLHIGCIARLSPEKGVDVLLSALTEVPEVNLSIVGTGREEGYLRTLIAEDSRRMGGERISLVHSLPDLEEFYTSLDALVLPSREHDPFGLTAAEAMMSGVPVLVTDACGIAGYLLSGIDALVVPADSISELAEAIRSLRDDALRTRLSQEGSITARKFFSISRMTEAYERLIRGDASTRVSS